MPSFAPLPTIVTLPRQVDQGLLNIGLSREIVRAIAVAAASARADSLAVDPSGTPGTLSYIYGVRATRLNLLPLGWRQARTGNVESTVNDDLNVQLFFQNVDIACTDRDPEAISGKGSASRSLIKSGQGGLFEAIQAESPNMLGRTPIVWLICVSVDDYGVRAEVSCPDVFEGNQFEGFVRRLFVIDESGEPKPTKRGDASDDGDFGFDVQISKK